MVSSAVKLWGDEVAGFHVDEVAGFHVGVWFQALLVAGLLGFGFKRYYLLSLQTLLFAFLAQLKLHTPPGWADFSDSSGKPSLIPKVVFKAYFLILTSFGVSKF